MSIHVINKYLPIFTPKITVQSVRPGKVLHNNEMRTEKMCSKLLNRPEKMWYTMIKGVEKYVSISNK